MTADDTIVLDAITNRVEVLLPEWFGGPATVSGREVRERRWSFIIRYAVYLQQCGHMALLVKVPRLSETTTLAQAAHATELVPYTLLEYQALQDVASAFRRDTSGAYCTIRPLAFLPDWNAFVMQEQPLTPLKRVLIRPALMLGRESAWQDVMVIYRRAASWLRVFHTQLGHVATEPFDMRAFEQQLEGALADLQQAAGGELDLSRIEAGVCARADALAGAPLATAGLHGDMSGANVFVTRDGRVGVLDPNGHMRGPIYHDLATLINDPFARIPFMVSLRPAAHRQRLSEIRAAVLEGYFDGEPYDSRALDLYAALVLVFKWTRHEARLSRLAGARALRAPLRRYFRSELSRYVDDNVQP